MKTIVVTGSTGNIGSKLVKDLLSKGLRVIAISRDASKSATLKALGADVRLGNMDDVHFLTTTFQGADAVFALIPPEYTAESFRGRQNIVGDVIFQAIKLSGVMKVVNLSSLGAEHADGVGPIKGLHDQEQRLNRIEGLDLVHLRAAYFYENTFFGAGLASGQGIFGTAVKEDVKFPHTSTRDIAATAATLLTDEIKAGRRIVEVISEEATTMGDVSRALSGAVGKVVPYVAFPYDGTRAALMESGLSADVADQFVELYHAMNTGLIYSNGLQFQRFDKTTFTSFINENRAVFGA
jgi:uncharacterized protein YbjT (DUF2867 family)